MLLTLKRSRAAEPAETPADDAPPAGAWEPWGADAPDAGLKVFGEAGMAVRVEPSFIRAAADPGGAARAHALGLGRVFADVRAALPPAVARWAEVSRQAAVARAEAEGQEAERAAVEAHRRAEELTVSADLAARLEAADARIARARQAAGQAGRKAATLGELAGRTRGEAERAVRAAGAAAGAGVRAGVRAGLAARRRALLDRLAAVAGPVLAELVDVQHGLRSLDPAAAGPLVGPQTVAEVMGRSGEEGLPEATLAALAEAAG